MKCLPIGVLWGKLDLFSMSRRCLRFELILIYCIESNWNHFGLIGCPQLTGSRCTSSLLCQFSQILFNNVSLLCEAQDVEWLIKGPPSLFSTHWLNNFSLLSFTDYGYWWRWRVTQMVNNICLECFWLVRRSELSPVVGSRDSRCSISVCSIFLLSLTGSQCQAGYIFSKTKYDY